MAVARSSACTADRCDLCGQFAVEASVAPDKQDKFLREPMQLLRRQARSTDAADLERARSQLAVRLLRDRDRPSRRMEQAALDLLALGRVRSGTEQLARIEAVTAAAVSETVQRMLQAGVSLAIAGSVQRAAGERARASLLWGG